MWEWALGIGKGEVCAVLTGGCSALPHGCHDMPRRVASRRRHMARACTFNVEEFVHIVHHTQQGIALADLERAKVVYVEDVERHLRDELHVVPEHVAQSWSQQATHARTASSGCINFDKKQIRSGEQTLATKGAFVVGSGLLLYQTTLTCSSSRHRRRTPQSPGPRCRPCPARRKCAR